MNRGAFQSSPVQQMMGGSPGWWNLNYMRQPNQQTTSPFLPSPPPSSISAFPPFAHPSRSLPLPSLHDNQELPESWSQLLLGGIAGEEERCSFTPFHTKKVENWEDPVLIYQQAAANGQHMADVKQESSESGYAYSNGNQEDIQPARSPWSQMLPVSSPGSCITSFSSNMLDFSNSKADGRHPKPDHSSECNSTATGSAFKKARVQGSSSAQSTFKVRKEKLGDRITALHQLVSPFGKTDTASVLLEAIGYIRFLQNQIEALSSPYLGNASSNTRHSSGQQGERGCIFPEDPGQLLNDACNKRSRGAPEQKEGENEPKKDLSSRGLCLVPISCTMHVGSDNGADFWAPAFGGGFR